MDGIKLLVVEKNSRKFLKKQVYVYKQSYCPNIITITISHYFPIVRTITNLYRHNNNNQVFVLMFPLIHVRFDFLQSTVSKARTYPI